MTQETIAQEVHTEKKNLIDVLSNINLTKEQIAGYQKSGRQTAIGTLRSSYQMLLFHKNFTKLEDGIADWLIKIGLIAKYIEDGSIDKPPFTGDIKDTEGNWDLDDTSIHNIRESLTSNTLEAAKNILNNSADNISIDADIPPENLITAISFLKVKAAIEGSDGIKKYDKDIFDK